MRPLLRFPGAAFPGRRRSQLPATACSPNTRALYSVRLWGPLDGLWSARFSIGLSNLGLSILNGFARQDGIGPLGRRVPRHPHRRGARSRQVDYLALTRREATDRHGDALVLDDYALDGSPEHGPVLYLAIRAPDRVGFLGRLMRALVAGSGSSRGR